MTQYILPLAIILMLPTALEAGPAGSGDGFLPFWSRFRQAALRRDMIALTASTRFPIKAYFDSDQGHPKSISRAQFPAYLRTELRCRSDDGGSNLDAIRRRVKLDPKYDYDAGPLATVGIFGFEPVGGVWKLASSNYASVEHYQARVKGRCD